MHRTNKCLIATPPCSRYRQGRVNIFSVRHEVTLKGSENIVLPSARKCRLRVDQLKTFTLKSCSVRNNRLGAVRKPARKPGRNRPGLRAARNVKGTARHGKSP